MINSMSHATVWVKDQEAAKAFYTEKLGFDTRMDITADGFRWLTVAPKGQSDFQLLLADPKPPMVEPEVGAQIKALLAKGVFGAGVMDTDDCRRTYEDLKAKGVTFLQEPAERPYGVEAVFRDDSGNWFSLRQPPK